MPFSLNDDTQNIAFPTVKQRGKKGRLQNQNYSYVSQHNNIHSKEIEQEGLSLQDEGDILSHEIELMAGDDNSQLFQSFDIFEDENLFSQFDDQRNNESEPNNKNNNVFDSANLYLNLSNKICPLQKDNPDYIKFNINLEVGNHRPNYSKQTTTKTRNHTGAYVT